MTAGMFGAAVFVGSMAGDVRAERIAIETPTRYSTIERPTKGMRKAAVRERFGAVSYTHLTLPTSG